MILTTNAGAPDDHQMSLSRALGGAKHNNLNTDIGGGHSPLQQQSQMRPRSQYQQLNDQSTNISQYSVAKPGGTTNSKNNDRQGTTPTRLKPGKLELHKLAELYKEYPQQLVRPQLITVDFSL